MKKLVTILFALVATAYISAQDKHYDLEYGGLYFRVTSDTTLEVSSSVANPKQGGNYLDRTSIHIPEIITTNGQEYAITSIGDNAFAYCDSLKLVTIPSSVTHIGNKAFIYCYNLNYLCLPTSILHIGEWAFYACSQLTAVAIPEKLTHISEYAFASCWSLKAIVIPNGVVSIGAQAFENCSALTHVAIPNSVEIINENAFAYCSGLDTVVIGNNVKSIGDQAFWKCEKLSSVNLPSTVREIGYAAFSDCALLDSITIPDSVTYVGERAFYKTGIYNDENNWENNVLYITNILIKAKDDLSGAYTIRDHTQLIAEHAFSNCDYMDSVAIASSVRIIGRGAFYGCKKLRTILIPDNVTEIGKLAFYYCSALSSITIGKGVVSIGREALADCYMLDTITMLVDIPPILGEGVFDGVDESIPVYTPCGTQDAYRASDWKYFVAIQEPLPLYEIITTTADEAEGMTWVDRNTLCGAAISAAANDGYLFVQWSDCVTDNPRTLVLTQDTILTAEFALKLTGQCGDSLYWEYKDSTLHISGTGAMYDFSKSAAPWKLLADSIQYVVVSKDATYIGEYAFENCSALSCITIPEGVTEVGDAAFYGCTHLKDITLPSTVQSIGDNGFALCSKLQKIHVKALTPPTIQAKTFHEVNHQIPVYVPDEVVDAYKSDPYWQDFNIQGNSNAPSAVDNITCTNASTRKTMRDGQLIILKGGKEYNAMGQEL